MNKTLTRLFTLMLLMMVSMGARADVKVLFGEKGTEKYEGKGGTIQVKQEESRDGGKVTVRLAFIPDKNYTFDEQSLEVYKVFSPESAATRALEIDGDALKLEEDKSTNPSEKHYHVDIDSKLALRVKEAQFINMRKSGDPITVTYHIINLGRLNDSGQLTDNRTEALQFTVTGENLTVGVPDKYKSPLAKNWVYYSSKDVNYDTTNKECTFIAGPSLSEGDELSEGDHVYVAYELDEDAFSTVGLNDGGIYRIKFPNNFYLKQDTWGSEINTSSANVTSPTSFEYLWKFNIVDPYQITIQSQSSSYTNYYLSSKTSKNDFADIRLQQTLSAAQDTKAWAFSLLRGGTDGTYRLIVTDGSTVNSTTDNRLDSYGHGYLNNNRKGNKTTYHLYYQTSGNQGEVNSTAYARCDLTIESLNANYTYNIVDTQGHIAIKYTVSQPMGSPLRGYEAIPAAIRSPYIEGETVTFYSSLSAEGSRDNLSGVITNTPLTGSDGSNIFVAYTNTQLRDKPLHLRGQRGFQMQINGEYVYENSGSLGHTSSTDDIDAQNYKWKFTGQDPYRVRIQNAVTGGHYLNWNISPSATLSLDASSNSYFILFGGNVERPGGVPSGQTDQIELMAANGADVSSNIYYNVGRATDVSLLASNSYPHEDAAIQVLLKADEHTMNFYIIDKSGHIVIEESGSYQDLVVPEQWQSPLVSDYHFYKLEDFTISNGVYTLNGTPAEIPSISEAPNDVYVTYDISDAYDLDGSENRTVDGKKYLLKFAGGTTFYQEKGDGFEATAAPGIYPYINGEGGLFVYGQAKLDATVDEVGSTRTRWAWYLEGGDPYRLRISSLQTRTDGTTDDTHYSYLRTYMPQGYDKVVTGVISNNSTVYDATDDAHAVRHKPTDYMILKGTNGHFRLVTTDVVDDLDGDATNDVRQTVTSFENYWKTNPTAANVIHDKDNSFTVGNIPTEAQITTALTTGAGAKGWHSYNVWANGSTWTNSKKTFDYGPHWFQTISVGTESDGTFNGDVDLVEYHLDGALILLDQHGWEVMRKPITNRAIDKAAYTAAIKKYDSPMVRKYHFWTNFTKESGYHKYKPIRGQTNESKNAQHKGEGASLANYPEVFSTGTLADIYVTYEVMGTYRNRYTGAETEENTIALPYLIRQGTNYAKTTDGSTITPVSAASVTDLSSAEDEMKWYVKPNFKIDTEMGYHYSGNGNIYEEKTLSETESDYYNNDDPIVYDTTNGQNGFDPYNLQIESVKYPGKLFTINATDAVRDGSGGMQSTYDGAKTVTLKEYAQAFTASDYYDIDVDTHTGYQMLHVTNSTFMAINDGNGNIRLMPRFDHQNVETAFTILDVPQPKAPIGDNGTSTQTTLFVAPTTTAEITSSDQILDLNGTYVLSENFEITRVIGTAGAPFTGTIDGKLRTIDGADRPLIGYAQDATIKNVILKDVQISQDGPVGAIAGTASGYTRIYNCGILPSNNIYVANDETSYVKSTGNSSSDVTDSYCGGLVGWLKDDSRVINCFSYANITGGTDVAGIVGHNEAVYTDSGTGYGSTTETNNGSYYRLKTAVVNCMFYGNITSGTNRWPVYGGAMMRNDTDNGINNYDFYRAEASLGLTDDSHYNCSWPAKEEYLTQYEFHRYLLNSNRELCGWWVGAPSAPSGMSTSDVQAVAKDASLIAKWVLDPSIAPYPILKTAGKYPSVVNQAPRPGETNPQRIDSETKQWVNRATSNNGTMANPKAAPETEGQIVGQITVTIDDDITGSDDKEKNFAITAMDFSNHDFCYGKIQLPYYNSIFGDPTVQVNAATLEERKTQWNSRYGGNYNDKVVVGWTITSVTGGITGITNTKKTKDGTESGEVVYDHTYSTNAESGYNFADRYCTTKDEERVFAQGGYYYVPYGVTKITIKAKWATAIYLDNSSNHDYDKVRMSQANDGKGKQFLPAGTRPTTLANGKSVVSGTIIDNIPSGGSVYENAIVLVGNHQYRTGNNSVKTSAGFGCTLMSADFDMDEEPDYCLIWQLGNGTSRYHICPIRFDFLPVVEIGLAMKQNASNQYYSLGCYRPLGHFEVTETSLIRFGQFEFGNSSRTEVAPLILNGGIFEQYVKGTEANAADKDYINYKIIGGNVRIPSFTPGAHVRGNANKSTRHCPLNVLGGNIDYLYLTGNYNESVTPNKDNPHCYIDGGNFEHIAAAGKEGINGDVYFNINHSVIQEFYGGSTMDKADGDNFKIVKGNIDVTIDNSMVAKYCGGPKFGDMVSGKTVTTRATGTTFGVYYGGGNGGTSYVQYASTDETVNDVTAGTYSWTTNSNGNGKLDGYTPGSYRGNGNKNYMADYEMEIVNTSAGTDDKKAVFRTYFYAAQFSATNTGSITNNLTDCTVLTNFYGGGNLGGVNGNVTSTLAGATRVVGSAFGAGFSAKAPEVTINNKDKDYPTINIYTGMITPTPKSSGSSTIYTWTHETSVGGNTLSTSNPKALNVEGKNYFYTEKSLDGLGSVTGKVTLTITDDTVIESKVFNDDGTVKTDAIGGVYGGGDESAVKKKEGVADSGNTTVILQGNAEILGNVFGGGNEGLVEGSTEVNIE